MKGNALMSMDRLRRLCEQYSNWGRWGSADEMGTLNFVTPDMVRNAAKLVVLGMPISLALPYDEEGPQNGAGGRFNPIRLMARDGADAVAGTAVRDFYGGVDQQFRAADDVIIMPLQAGTQWDALSHVILDTSIYNGYPASDVSSKGALRNDVAKGASGMVGRGVLLDVAGALHRDWLDVGTAIESAELDNACEFGDVEVRRGDFVFVRTGAIACARMRGHWGDYAGGPSAGLGLDAVGWLADRSVAAVATDTWGMEVRPSEIEGVLQPLHSICIVHMGLWVGEIFDLEALAVACSSEGRYEFLFCGPPLPFTRAVGSPVNPMALM